MLTGLPKTVIISSEEVRHALEEPVTQIVDAIKSTLDKTLPSWPRTSWTAASSSPAAARS